MTRTGVVAAALATAIVGCNTTSSATSSPVPSPSGSPTGVPGLTFTPAAAGVIVREHVENGKQILYADITVARLPDGSYMVYALKHNPIGVAHSFLSYVGFRSNDGIHFDPTEIPLSYSRRCTDLVMVVQEGSGYRMYCTVITRPYPHRVSSIISEYSRDGIHFNLEAGTGVPLNQVDPSFEVHTPSAVYDLADGRHRMLFMVITTPPTLQPFSNVIYGATSTDWLNWSIDSESVLNEGARQLSSQRWPTVVRWRDRYLMFYNSKWQSGSAPALGNPGVEGIYLATSFDGIAFTTAGPVGIHGSESAGIVMPDGRIALIYNTACCPLARDTVGSSQLEVAVLTPNQ